MKILAIALIAGKLFWLGLEAVKLGSYTLGLTMMACSVWICLTTK